MPQMWYVESLKKSSLPPGYDVNEVSLVEDSPGILKSKVAGLPEYGDGPSNRSLIDDWKFVTSAHSLCTSLKLQNESGLTSPSGVALGVGASALA